MATLRSDKNKSLDQGASKFFKLPLTGHVNVSAIVFPPPFVIGMDRKLSGSDDGEKYVTWVPWKKETKSEGNCLNEFCALGNAGTSDDDILAFIRRWGPLGLKSTHPRIGILLLDENGRPYIKDAEDSEVGSGLVYLQEIAKIYYQYSRQFRAMRSLIYALRRNEKTADQDWKLLFSPKSTQVFNWPDGDIPTLQTQKLIVAQFLTSWLDHTVLNPSIEWERTFDPAPDEDEDFADQPAVLTFSPGQNMLVDFNDIKVKNRVRVVSSLIEHLELSTQATKQYGEVMASLFDRIVKSNDAELMEYLPLSYKQPPPTLFVSLIWQLIAFATEEGYATKCMRCGSLELSKRKPRIDKDWFCPNCQRLRHNEVVAASLKRKRAETKRQKEKNASGMLNSDAGEQ